MTTAPIVCVHCRQTCGSRFEITRFDNANTNKGTVVACSTICLVRWAYEYSTLQGARLAFGVKNSITSLIDSLRGAKR